MLNHRSSTFNKPKNITCGFTYFICQLAITIVLILCLLHLFLFLFFSIYLFSLSLLVSTSVFSFLLLATFFAYPSLFLPFLPFPRPFLLECTNREVRRAFCETLSCALQNYINNGASTVSPIRVPLNERSFSNHTLRAGQYMVVRLV